MKTNTLFKRITTAAVTLTMLFTTLPMTSLAANTSKIENAVSIMENMASDNSYGYDQKYRWGEKGDYDCSSAVITAWEVAGVKVKSTGATYTGNMRAAFMKCGFQDVTSKVNLTTGAGLKRGDVLLNTSYHTAMYCGNGKLVEASINEKGTITGGKPGDQTGREFWKHSYYNYPWNYVLRYRGSSSTGRSSAKKITFFNCNVELRTVKGKDTNLYRNVGDSKRVDYFNRGQVAYSKYGAKVNGETWYQIQAYAYGTTNIETYWLKYNKNTVKVKVIDR